MRPCAPRTRHRSARVSARACFCQDRSRTTAGNTKRDSPCTFPARSRVQAPPVPVSGNQGVGTARVDTRAARKSWGASSHQRALYTSPVAPRHRPQLRGKRSYIAMRVAGTRMPPGAETTTQGRGAGGAGSSLSGRYEQPPPGRSGSARRAAYTPMHEFPSQSIFGPLSI